MPLGSGALATSNYSIYKRYVANELSFNKISLNGTDSVSVTD